jgi:hypothetical protein
VGSTETLAVSEGCGIEAARGARSGAIDAPVIDFTKSRRLMNLIVFLLTHYEIPSDHESPRLLLLI